MSTIEIVLTVVGAVLGYFALAGVTCALSNDIDAALIGAIWPFSLPAILGFRIVKWIQAPRAAKLPRARVVNRSDDE